MVRSASRTMATGQAETKRTGKRSKGFYSNFKQQHSSTRLRDPAACFARVLSSTSRPQFRGRRECRTLGASAAACAVVESTRVSHHGHAGNVRHSPRNGFNGFLRALPGDRACLPPSPLRSLLLRNLMPASGHQDHTTSPSAGPRARQSRGSRPPHPAPTFVTMANAPLRDRTGQVLKVIWVKREAEYFCKWDWTTQITLIRFNKLDF